MGSKIDTFGQAHFLEVEALIAEGLTIERAAVEIVRKYGAWQKPASLVRAYQHYRLLASDLPDVMPPIPEPLERPYADRYVMADAHMPYIHKLALSTMLCEARQDGIKILDIGGDTLDNDWCSQFMNVSAPGTADRVSQHALAIYELLYALCGVFDEINILPGNHDDRLMKAVQRRLSFDHWLKIFTIPSDNSRPSIFSRFNISGRFYMKIIGGPTGDWRLTHQKNYSKLPTRVAQELAKKYGCNVVTTHEHGGGAIPFLHGGRDLWAVACPMMADQRKVEYKVMRDSLNPDFVTGWVVIKNGVPTVRRYETR